jgi:hypothetical protein
MSVFWALAISMSNREPDCMISVLNESKSFLAWMWNVSYVTTTPIYVTTPIYPNSETLHWLATIVLVSQNWLLAQANVKCGWLSPYLQYSIIIFHIVQQIWNVSYDRFVTVIIHLHRVWPPQSQTWIDLLLGFL